ncbi:MAG: TetR/AcrR family transcriptional regulator [Vicinamibacteria bacterium]|nr:TetR/AcrR family transcriptional regulator [Vicinamibacteria bacterium]
MARPIHDPRRAPTASRLLDAAEGEFARDGFDAARLEDVAREASIHRPSLLHHFPSKEALYAAVVARSFAALGAALSDTIAAPGPFDRRLERLVRAFARFVDARPSLARIVLREVLGEGGPGREILLAEVAPLLGQVERFVRKEGRNHIRPRLPVRAALVDTASALLTRAASGDLRRPLWGASDAAWPVARALFLKESAR